jgi:hypothetical protein
MTAGSNHHSTRQGRHCSVALAGCAAVRKWRRPPPGPAPSRLSVGAARRRATRLRRRRARGAGGSADGPAPLRSDCASAAGNRLRHAPLPRAEIIRRGVPWPLGVRTFEIASVSAPRSSSSRTTSRWQFNFHAAKCSGVQPLCCARPHAVVRTKAAPRLSAADNQPRHETVRHRQRRSSRRAWVGARNAAQRRQRRNQKNRIGADRRAGRDALCAPTDAPPCAARPMQRRARSGARRRAARRHGCTRASCLKRRRTRRAARQCAAVEMRGAHVFFGILVGAAIQQHPRDLQMAILSGIHQRRSSVLRATRRRA